MDNLTHSLAGVAVAEVVFHRLDVGVKKPSRHLRRTLWLASLLANNFPDLDIAYSTISGPAIGYLLHHRGHTHTLLGALPLSGLAFLITYLWRRAKGGRLSASEWRWVGAVALMGGVLHIAMDSLNSYGVHPFWPLDNRWYYGDSIFIIEPWLWACLLPAFLELHSARTWDWFFRTLWGLTFLVVWRASWIPPSLCVALNFVSLLLFLFYQRISWRKRVLFSIGNVLVVVGFFLFLSRSIRAEYLAEIQTARDRVADVILSPFPANPFCWSLIGVGEQGDDYLVREAVWAPFPDFFPESKCPTFRQERGTAPLEKVEGSSTKVRWIGAYRFSRKKMAAFADQFCTFRAALKFYRAPFVVEEGEGIIVGDLRFDSSGRRSFAEVHLKLPDPCPPLFRRGIPRRCILISDWVFSTKGAMRFLSFCLLALVTLPTMCLCEANYSIGERKYDTRGNPPAGQGDLGFFILNEANPMNSDKHAIIGRCVIASDAGPGFDVPCQNIEISLKSDKETEPHRVSVVGGKFHVPVEGDVEYKLSILSKGFVDTIGPAGPFKRGDVILLRLKKK